MPNNTRGPGTTYRESLNLRCQVVVLVLLVLLDRLTAGLHFVHLFQQTIRGRGGGGGLGKGGETEGKNETRQSVQGREARNVATLSASESACAEVAGCEKMIELTKLAGSRAEPVEPAQQHRSGSGRGSQRAQNCVASLVRGSRTHRSWRHFRRFPACPGYPAPPPTKPSLCHRPTCGGFCLRLLRRWARKYRLKPWSLLCQKEVCKNKSEFVRKRFVKQIDRKRSCSSSHVD